MSKTIFSLFTLVAALIFFNCGGGSGTTTDSGSTNEEKAKPEAQTSSYDPNRGEGKYDESNMAAGPLDAHMAQQGKDIAATKCTSCHKLTDEKLVGPGWKGVTERKTLHWLMNFITNPDPMIDKDPELQAQLEICLVRMPNQNLTESDARNIVEFMRQNDGAK